MAFCPAGPFPYGMLSNDIPVGSVSGRGGWGSAEPSDRDPDRNRPRHAAEEAPPGPRDRRERIRELQREVTALEEELERKDRRLEYVVEHYERMYSDLLERRGTDRDAVRDDRGPGRSRPARPRLRELLPAPIARRIPDRFRFRFRF